MDEPTLLADRPGTPQPDTSLRWPALAKRALTLAKYFPAVLCGLLAVAWVVSDLRPCFAYMPLNRPVGTLITELWQGEIGFCLKGNYIHSLGVQERMNDNIGLLSAGRLGAGRDFAGTPFVTLPIPLLLTLLVPVAIGSFIHFRFPLWSWFAWTALIAVELAFYLR